MPKNLSKKEEKEAFMKLLMDVSKSLELRDLDKLKLKTKELMEDFFSQAGMKDADKYFEKLPSLGEGGLPNGQPIIQGGAGGIGASPVGVGSNTAQSMAGSIPTVAGSQG